MRTYLANLHKQPPHHKKRFAFLVSGGITLLIFVVWALVNFGINDSTQAASAQTNESVSPFASLTRGVAASFAAFRSDTKELKKGLEVVDSNSTK